MNVQFHAAAKSLREADSSTLCGAKPGEPGALALPAKNLLHKNSADCSEGTRIAREQKPQLEWHGEHPLSQRCFGNARVSRGLL